MPCLPMELSDAFLAIAMMGSQGQDMEYYRLLCDSVMDIRVTGGTGSKLTATNALIGAILRRWSDAGAKQPRRVRGRCARQRRTDRGRRNPDGG